MQTEIEAKWLNIDLEPMRKRLLDIGAELVAKERLMTRMVYDYPDKRLEKIGGWIRVRNEGDKITLSYKQLNDRALHGTKEVTVIVDNFEAICSFLDSIGMKSNSFQEMKRESWKLGSVEIELDTWPWIPIFVGDITPLGNARIKELRDTLPRKTKDFLARFEADLDPSIATDQRYEFRVNLVPKLGSKTQADRSLTFVRENELTDEQKKTLKSLGKSGNVIVREQVRSIVSADKMRPSSAVEKIQERTPFKFNMNHFVRAWQKSKVRPSSKDPHPERTDERYCFYDKPHRDYLYTEAFVDLVTSKTGKFKGFKVYLGIDPVPKEKTKVKS